MAWAKYVPDTETPITPIPLEYHRFVQAGVPVAKGTHTTISGGLVLNLPSAFASYIQAYGPNYIVILTKETFLPGGGELYVTNKTTSTFTVRNTGSTYGESFAFVVFWTP